MVEEEKSPPFNARVLSGLSLNKLGRTEEAVAVYRELLSSADERRLPYVKNNLAWVLLWPGRAEPGSRDQLEEARSLAAEAAASMPHVASFRGTLATAQILLGETEGGGALLGDVMREQSNARSLALNACMLAYATADKETARLARMLDPECDLLPLIGALV